jgi:hypothetical protein
VRYLNRTNLYILTIKIHIYGTKFRWIEVPAVPFAVGTGKYNEGDIRM